MASSINPSNIDGTYPVAGQDNDSQGFRDNFTNVKTNFIFHEDVAKILFKLINKKGIINVGGKIQSVYNFVKKYNPKIKKNYAKKILGNKFPLNPSMNINKLKKIIKSR